MNNTATVNTTDQFYLTIWQGLYAKKGFPEFHSYHGIENKRSCEHGRIVWGWKKEEYIWGV